MTGQPPSGPSRYKIAAPQEAPTAPQRLKAPPPVQKKMPLTYWEALFRLGIVLIIIISAAVAYWSFFLHLLPLQKQSRLMVTKVSKMSEETDQMERRWSPTQTKQIRDRFHEVSNVLLADESATRDWLRQVQALATPLALDLNVGFGETAPQAPLTNLNVVPTSLSLEILPAPGDTNGESPYQRVLSFGQQLAALGKRADLAELNVIGGTGSVQRATLVFNLWVGDPGADNPATPAKTKEKPRSK